MSSMIVPLLQVLEQKNKQLEGCGTVMAWDKDPKGDESCPDSAELSRGFRAKDVVLRR